MNQDNNNRPLVLAVLDGLALNPNAKGNAVEKADTPNLDRILKECPATTLLTSGQRVGLPEGQMGNSEVGHLNLGGGRIVEQELTRINNAIEEGRLAENEALSSIFESVKSGDERVLHLIGLVSRGGVHSYLEHLQAIIEQAVAADVPQIAVHAITDGRDCSPTASLADMEHFNQFLDMVRMGRSTKTQVAVCTLVGRYYAMDRDKRWDRTRRAFDLFVSGRGEEFIGPMEALKARHQSGQTDEFIEPVRFNPLAISRSPHIQDDDAVLFFNFRADRMRQIVSAFLGKVEVVEFNDVKPPSLCSLGTLTEYDDDFDVTVLFPPLTVKNHLGHVISDAGLKQLRVAETEKYPHVTYFFNGGVEDPLPGEERVLIPSPRDIPTYDHKPEMSAEGVTNAVIKSLNEKQHEVIIVNFANCDMVGHTGDFDATVKAVEFVDSCLGRILEATKQADGVAIVTADHGNADQMVDYETGGPHTFHTKHPVPFIICGLSSKSAKLREGGSLCDVAPTVCDLLGLKIPAEMTGQSLLQNDTNAK